MLRDLRAAMERTTTVAGLRINPVVKLSDGLVIAWGLALANMTMNPKCALIDRTKFLENLDRELVQRLAEFGDCTDDERRARLEMLVAGASEFSAYDPSSPLRAVGTMTNLQEIQLRVSEIRQKLNTISGPQIVSVPGPLIGEALTAESRAEAEALLTELTDLEIRQAAIVAEGEEIMACFHATNQDG